MKLPDVALETNLRNTPLEWVGMERIRLPLSFVFTGEAGAERKISVTAEVSGFVSLDLAEARGIHMSRLYLSIQKLAEKSNLRLEDLETVLQEFLENHKDLSRWARLVLRFQLPVLRSALLSEATSWKTYPLQIDIQKSRGPHEEKKVEVDFSVEYSSTCPASTALAREANRETFLEHFKGQNQVSVAEVEAFLSSSKGLSATPHAQRSLASVKLTYSHFLGLSFSRFIEQIDGVEGALKTPVQGAVKRVDEQEFARLNGQNPMFCEDAARRIAAFLEIQGSLENFTVKVEHFESLHAHNAVAFARKRK